MKFIQDNNINYWPTPAESPDMNSIENLWHELKHFLRTVVKYTNKEELVAGIQGFWDTVKPERCRRYISHLKKVLPAVVERRVELLVLNWKDSSLKQNGSFRSHHF